MVRFNFAHDGGGPGKGGRGRLFVDGQKVAEGHVEHTQGGVFSADPASRGGDGAGG
jgi:arylsulfatase